jgi:ribose transport system ATP-binding protein
MMLATISRETHGVMPENTHTGCVCARLARRLYAGGAHTHYLSRMSSARPPESAPALRIRGISKAYPGVQALDGVTLEIRSGEVHVLLGENGAGKSTLLKILSGALLPDSGTIEIDGTPLRLTSPRQARDAGIAIIHQELALVPGLSVAANIFLGREPTRYRLIDRARMRRESGALLAELGASIDPDALIASLSIAQRQVVEIARALSLNARIVLMDEPTSALSEPEAARLFALIRVLVGRGVATVYISHRLDEIFAIGDTITVLRDGRQVSTQAVRGADRRQLVRLMADREVDERMPATGAATDRVRLRVAGLSSGATLQQIEFSVHEGEIVGIAGLMGAGRTELARAIFGLDPCDAGTVSVDGRAVTIRCPRDAIAAGIAFVTEDRQHEGLVLDRSVMDNIALATLPQRATLGFVHANDERAVAESAVAALRIRTPSVRQAARHLSGGNQQKTVLAKWLATGARVFILDEPTRGIDVGSKQELYALIRRLASDGVAIVLISSELPEVLALADRVLVMRQGRIAGEFARADATADCVMACAVGL